MNEGDRLKRILVLCLVVLMMAGCATEECIRLAMAFCVFRRKKWMVQLEQSET